MRIETLVLGRLRTNCYLVYHLKSAEGVVIDPADEGEFIGEKIQKLKFKPKAIIATHGHFDHLLAAGELEMIFSDFSIPFFIHQKDFFLLKRANQSASHWLNLAINQPQPTKIKFIKQNDQIKLTNFSLKVIETPGHTPGSVSLLLNPLTDKLAERLTLFSGDTLFKNGIGRGDFSYSSKKKLNQSLKRLFQLPETTVVYPGHGEKTTIGQEKNQLLT